MRWKINSERVDDIMRGQRFEFEIAKSLDDLAAGSLGLSIEAGKAVMPLLQRHIVEQQSALYVLFRGDCQTAEVLDVSRPVLIRLREDGNVPHRKVVRHCRVRMVDVMAYKGAIDGKREAILVRLAADAQRRDMGYGSK